MFEDHRTRDRVGVLFQGVADGTGGDVFGNGDAAGNGSAGAVYFSAQSGGDINVTGSAFLTGDGYGGDVISPVTAFNVNGGIGRGSDYLQDSATAVYGVGM